MRRRPSRPSPPSLLPRLLAAILALTTLATALFGAAAILLERRLLLGGLEASAERGADYLARGLAYPIWNFVEREVELLLDWALRDPAVYGLILSAEGFDPGLLARSRGPDWEALSLPPAPRPDCFSLRRDIVFEGRKVGGLELYFTRRFIEERAAREALAIAALALALDLVLVFGLAAALRAAVFRPLWRIERWASELSAGAAEPLDGGGGEFRGEIGSLKASIEGMVRLLAEGYATIAARELDYRSLFESNPIPTWELDFSALRRELGRAAASRGSAAPSAEEARGLIPLIGLRSLNAAARSRLGLEGLGRLPGAMDGLLTEEILALLSEEIDALAAGRTEAGMECRVGLPGGGERILILHFAVLAGHEADWSRVVLTAVDITDRALALRELRKALEEKEVLIGELFHRTRNSLQIMSSMLALREARRPEPSYRAELRAIRSRIASMSIAQDLLYQSGELSSVELEAYIPELLRVLVEGEGRRRVETSLELERVSVLVDCALPLGLLFCELVSNSLEHAFPGEEGGRISVRLRRTAEGEVELRVADDGVGAPPGFDPRREAGFGLETALALGEGQLRGRLSFELEAGFAATLRFEPRQFRRRV